MKMCDDLCSCFCLYHRLEPTDRFIYVQELEPSLSPMDVYGFPFTMVRNALPGLEPVFSHALPLKDAYNYLPCFSLELPIVEGLKNKSVSGHSSQPFNLPIADT